MGNRRPGLLSAMVLTWGTGLVAVLGGAFFPAWVTAFDQPVSKGLLDAFLVSIGVMVLHKLESYLTGEYEVCPVYVTNGEQRWARDARQAMFVSFVGTFLVLIIALALVMRGGYWPLLLLSVWMAQGVHEWHHLAKSLAAGRYYPGSVTSLFYVLSVVLWVFPEWVVLIDGPTRAITLGYWAIQPAVFLGFYLEYRSWLSHDDSLHLARPTS